MEVDYCVENQLHLCPRDFLKPMSLVMDDRGSLPNPRSSGLRVSTKSKAPSPPGLKKLDPPGFSQWIPGNPHLTMDLKENLIDKDLSLVVVLPGGEEKITTVHGSKPLMDLLVTLCAKYHLNPSSHTLELVTTNKKNTKLKPNALIGTLDAEKIVLKPKGEDKNKKTGPQMPEATVRMVINYRKTQKTILRVNPRVPLADHLPAICEKCEFEMETTVLLRDVQSLAPLDLSCSLNDYAIRELYARDSKRQPASPVSQSSPTLSAVFPGKDKNQKEEENKGLLSKFRKSKKKSDQAVTASAPASPVLVSKPRPLSMALPSSNSSPFSSATLPGDGPKKRRAPPPPVLVSPSTTSDLTARRRINSEPNTQLEREQIALSRGSSGESSLKRTKRKAPPPPTSPSPVVQRMVPVDEDLQGVITVNTLGEISEQEESTASVKSPPASDTQGEDRSLNMSADISLSSPSPETDIVSTVPVEGNGDDQSPDLSSDGDHQQSPVKDAAARSDVMTAVTASSEPGDTDRSPDESEKVPAPESVNNDDITVPSDPPPPVTQEAEAQASAQENTETLCEQTDGPESPVATSTSHSPAEDAEVQTQITPPPVPSPQPTHGVPNSAKEPAFKSAEKKDAATSKQEPELPDLKQDSPHNSETSCQDSTSSAPATTQAPCIYSRDSEPKPKPSNELTRDYIPKVGMTTYTIVPQKSLEKLRYFEVALTLESPPPVAEEEGLDIGSLQLEESPAQKEQKVSEEEKELQSSKPREALLTSATTTNHTVNGSIPELTHSASPTTSPKPDVKTSSSAARTSQASSPTEVKDVKIPPATKPKPGSFRLAQHKKVPGYYVTSAVERSLGSCSSSGEREAQNVERAQFLPPPPPPPPSHPVQSQEDTTGGADVELTPKRDYKHAPILRFTRQSSLPTKEPRPGLSLEKLRSFAAPRPFSPATQSRFAQAVSSAVKRSHSLSHRPTPPRTPSSEPVSPIPGRSPAIESKGLSNLKECKGEDVDNDKGSILQAIENEAPSLSGIILMEGESSP